MVEYLSLIATSLGISIWLTVVLLAWSMVWKLLALWKSARKGSVAWFIVLAIINTVGILPILYIFWFSEMKCCKALKKKVGKKK